MRCAALIRARGCYALCARRFVTRAERDARFCRRATLYACRLIIDVISAVDYC